MHRARLNASQCDTLAQLPAIFVSQEYPAKMSSAISSHPASAISEQSSKPTLRAANAGIMLLVVVCICALVGYLLGSLVGLPIAIGLAGLIIGPIVGIAFVRSRFRDL